MAPGLVTPQRQQRQLPTDVWWHTIVPTNGREKTGHPNQKPEGIVKQDGAGIDSGRGLAS